MVEKKVEVKRGYEPDTRREGFMSAFLQVLAVLILVSGAVYMYAMDSLEKDRIAQLILDAKRIQKGDDAVSLLKAKKNVA